MTTPMIKGCAGLVLAAIAGSCASAADKSELRINTELTGKTEIHLMQTAQRAMPRDRLRADLRIELRGNNGKQIQDEVNKRMAAALQSARKYSDITIETGSYNVFREPESKSPDTWHASQNLALASGNFEELLNLVGELQSGGMLMSGMRFYLAPETLKAAQSDLTAQALNELRDRGNEIAGDLGMAIDHYKQINVGNAFETNEGGVRMGVAALAATEGRAPPPAAQAGESKVVLTVQADLILVPNKTH